MNSILWTTNKIFNYHDFSGDDMGIFKCKPQDMVEALKNLHYHDFSGDDMGIFQCKTQDMVEALKNLHYHDFTGDDIYNIS